MPFRAHQTISTGEVIDIYNIDYAIGSSGWNLRTDVKLVQALLRLYYHELAGMNEGGEAPSREPIVVDGYCGQMTRRYLMQYQQEAHKRGQSVLIDGRFDPFRGHNRVSFHARVQYQLESLNFRCDRFCFRQQVDWFSNLSNQPYVAEHTDLVRALRGPVREMAQQYCYRN